jgi:hypothetical protein
MSAIMSSTKRVRAAASVAAVLLCGAQFLPAVAHADPEVPPGPDVTQQPADAPPAKALADLGPGPYNVTYRARVDGVSRGATISYVMAGSQINTANPTMVPGRVFEANAVLDDAQTAGMQVSIRWPYSASLHCEIQVNDQITAEADQFVAPRLLPQENDPGYGVLSCGTVTNFATADPGVLVDTPPPADADVPPPPTT